MKYFGFQWTRKRRFRWIAIVFALLVAMCTYVHFEANRIRPAFDALLSPIGEVHYKHIDEWCRGASDPKEVAKRARDADTWPYRSLGISGRLAASRAGYPFLDSIDIVSVGSDWYDACMFRLVELNTPESLNEFLSVYLDAQTFNDAGFAESALIPFFELGQSAFDAIDRYVPDSDKVRRKLQGLRKELVQDASQRSGK